MDTLARGRQASPGGRGAPNGRYTDPAMARIVMKFGGTSVGDVERIKNVARRVKREVDAGNEVAVVVSAMSGTTNQLVKWCGEVSRLYDAREYDVVVASGEQVPVGLLAMALQDSSDEHTSELQSLMRISYDVFCL